MIKSLSQDLNRAIFELKTHDQVCLLYEGHHELPDAVLAFIKAGLAQGDKCVYIISDGNLDRATKQLAQMDRDDSIESKSNALAIINKKEFGSMKGDSYIEEMIQFYQSLLLNAQKAGYARLRIIEDMVWSSQDQIATNDLLPYITKLNQFLTQSPAIGLFLYNRQSFSAKTILDVLKTHHLIITKSDLLENAFYVSPEKYNTDQQAEHEIESLLAGLKSLKNWEHEFLTIIKDLRGLLEINKTISGTLNISELGNEVLNNLYQHLKPKAGAILILNPGEQILEYHSTCGFLNNYPVDNLKLDINQSLPGKAIIEQRSLVIEDIWNHKQQPEGVKFANEDEKEFNTYYAIVLVSKNKITGVLEVYLQTTPESKERWLPFLTTLANQLATMIENAQQFEALQQRIVELTLAYDVTINRMVHSIDQYENTISLYTQSVSDMTERLARSMGASEQDLIHIRRGALLNYISKLSLPEKILQKPGPLTDKEWEVIRQHPQIAFSMFSDIKLLKPALDIPYCHHEKWDGSGYPQGLQGAEIPLAARQFAVVDVYHALLTERPYRQPWEKVDVLAYIQSLSGSNFDPEVVTAFLEMVNVEGS
jgi:HD-GYP domain-containing protein (c-di-GMP phosphodiesterase class II)